MTPTSEIRIKLFSGKQVGQHPGIKLKQATKYSDSLVPKVGGSTSPEWWVNINRNGGSTWVGIYTDPTQPGFDHEQYYGQHINPFDPSNMIHLPVDRKTILTVLPATGEHPSDYLQRMEIGKVDVLMYNSDIQKYSEDWVLGSKRGIEDHISDQLTYNEVNEQNISMVTDYKEKALLFKEFLDVLEKYGAKSSEVRNKIEELKKKPSIASDSNFQRYVKRIEI